MNTMPRVGLLSMRECPFCGAPLHFEHIVGNGGLFHATCPRCMATGPLSGTIQGAWLRWNQREDDGPTLPIGGAR